MNIVAVDAETTGLIGYGDVESLGYHPARPFLWSFTTYAGEDSFVRFEVDPFTRQVLYGKNPEDYAKVKTFFEDPGIVKVMHNASFDLRMVRYMGIRPVGPFVDTRILAHVANSSRPNFQLKPLGKVLLNFSDDDEKALKDSVKKARRLGKKLGYKLSPDVEGDYHLGDPELCARYAVCDTQRTMGLFKLYEDLLTDDFDKWSPYERYNEIVTLEHEVMAVAQEMTAKGCAVDMNKVRELRAYYEGVITEQTARKEALGYGDLNATSPAQKNKVFYREMHMEHEYRKRKQKDGTKKKTLSADKTALVKWAHKNDLADCLLNLSEANKQLSGFINPFEKNSFDEGGLRVIHTDYKTVGPKTGRLSSSPNLQNISSPESPGRKSSVLFRARECFGPRPGKVWLLADYDQIEIVIAAYMSKDPVMVGAIENGISLHDVTRDKVFSRKPDFEANKGAYRKKAKIINFLMQYEGGIKALAAALDVPYNEAKEYWLTYWDTYAGLRTYNDMVVRMGKQNGFVKDVFGRPYFAVKGLEYVLANYVTQGPAARIIKEAMVKVHPILKARGWDLLLQVHDELIMEGPEENMHEIVPLVREAMQQDFHTLIGKSTPLGVGFNVVRTNWAEKEDL